MSLTKRVEEYIKINSLVSSFTTKIIVGFSGGADSVCLLHILHSLGYNCVAAHCNFHLRGEESDCDALFAKEFAGKIGVEFRSIDFDTDSFCASNHGVSIEMACRKLRYDWFHLLSDEYAPAVIAVAHHVDDNIETLMINLCRGTGIGGVRGMTSKNFSGVIRPLLCASRAEIENYLRSHSLSYIIDSSNLCDSFIRNRFRNKILPEVFSLIPDSRKGLIHSISDLSENYSFYMDSVRDRISKYIFDDGGIDVGKLSSNEKFASLMLFEYVCHELSRKQCDDIISSPLRSGRFFGRYILDRGTLRIISEHRVIPDINHFSIEVCSMDMWEYEEFNNNTAYFDADLIDESLLSVRYWRPGDRLKPYGMKGSRKVSDIFNDLHIPVDIKSTIPLLILGDDILWVAGVRASRLFSITESTTRYLRIRFLTESL